MMSGFGHVLDSLFGWLAATMLNLKITLGKGGMTRWKEGNVCLGLFINVDENTDYVDAWKKKTLHIVHLSTFILLTDL